MRAQDLTEQKTSGRPRAWRRDRLTSRQDGVDERQYAPVVVARNAPFGMRVHVLLGIVHDKAVTDALQHGDVVVGVAHGGSIGNIDARTGERRRRPCRRPGS